MTERNKYYRTAAIAAIAIGFFHWLLFPAHWGWHLDLPYCIACYGLAIVALDGLRGFIPAKPPKDLPPPVTAQDPENNR